MSTLNSHNSYSPLPTISVSDIFRTAASYLDYDQDWPLNGYYCICHAVKRAIRSTYSNQLNTGQIDFLFNYIDTNYISPHSPDWSLPYWWYYIDSFNVVTNDISFQAMSERFILCHLLSHLYKGETLKFTGYLTISKK